MYPAETPTRRPATWRAKRGRPVVACKDDYRQRYTVERSFAWLGNFRRLLIRWERRFDVYRSFFDVAIMLLSVRRSGAMGQRHGRHGSHGCRHGEWDTRWSTGRST